MAIQTKMLPATDKKMSNDRNIPEKEEEKKLFIISLLLFDESCWKIL